MPAAVIDLDRRTLTRGPHQFGLTEIEARLLQWLAQHPVEPASRDTLLREVWGYAPGVVTKAVDKTVYRLRCKLEDDPAAPVHLVSLRGVGYRLETANLAFERGRDEAPAARAPERRLEPEMTSLVGRTSEIALVARRFREGTRLLTVVGPPGIGKTRLARRWALTVAENEPPAGGVWFCDLSAARTADDVASAVATSLDAVLTAPTTEGRVSQVGRALAGRGDPLVVLDNFEQIAAHASHTLGTWLAAAARARFVVTSRERLRLPGEATLRLEPLPEADAVALFRARADALGAPVTDADVPVVAAIVRRLDALPLAIEMATARLAVLSPRQVLDRLADRFALLSHPDRDPTDRVATLRGTIDWSWDLLSASERAALATVACFRGGFSLAAAGAVLELGESDALSVLQALCDKSLLRPHRPVAFPEAVRFAHYESIREYAAERLDDRGARLRHMRWYAEEGTRLADEAELGGGAATRRRLALDQDDLVAALDLACEVDGDAAARLAKALYALRYRIGPTDAFVGWLDRAVEATGRSDVLEIRGRVRESRGDLDGARADYEAMGESGVVHVAWWLIRRGRVAEGEPLLDRVPAEPRAQIHAWAARAFLARQRGRWDEAEAAHEAELLLVRELGWKVREGRVLGNLGRLVRARGRPELAIELHRRALELDRLAGDPYAEAMTLGALGNCALDLEDHDEAAARYAEALEVHRATGRGQTEAIFLTGLGVLALDRGDAATGRERLLEAEAVLERFRAEAMRVVVRGYRASADQLAGRRVEARAGYEAALAGLADGPDRVRLLARMATLVGAEVLDGIEPSDELLAACVALARDPAADVTEAESRSVDVRLVGRLAGQ